MPKRRLNQMGTVRWMERSLARGWGRPRGVPIGKRARRLKQLRTMHAGRSVQAGIRQWARRNQRAMNELAPHYHPLDSGFKRIPF
jgi:hypothetical protein